KQCFICGMENPVGLHLHFEEKAPGEVTADCVLDERYQGYPGIVHGGIVAAMLDEVSGRALMGDAKNPRFMYTAKMNIRYRKHVPVGEPLHLVGKVGKDRGRTAIAYASITDQNNNVLAECESLLVDVPPDDYRDVNLEEFGWRIYADEELT
ncbi:MAG: PaaI family thioesterase, partial [Candidatus Kryptoniota bacterium]